MSEPYPSPMPQFTRQIPPLIKADPPWETPSSSPLSSRFHWTRKAIIIAVIATVALVLVLSIGLGVGLHDNNSKSPLPANDPVHTDPAVPTQPAAPPNNPPSNSDCVPSAEQPCSPNDGNSDCGGLPNDVCNMYCDGNYYCF